MDKERYYIIKESYIRDLGLKGSELLVYAFLASYSKNSKEVKPSQQMIATMCGITTRQAIKLIEKLKQKGLIEVSRNNHYSYNYYQINKCKKFSCSSEQSSHIKRTKFSCSSEQSSHIKRTKFSCSSEQSSPNNKDSNIDKINNNNNACAHAQGMVGYFGIEEAFKEMENELKTPTDALNNLKRITGVEQEMIIQFLQKFRDTCSYEDQAQVDTIKGWRQRFKTFIQKNKNIENGITKQKQGEKYDILHPRFNNDF